MRTLPDADRLAGIVDVTTVGDCVERAAQCGPDRDALVLPTERLSYRQLADRVDLLARSLLAIGVGHGEKVGILMPQEAENLALFLATAKIGAIAVPINSRFKAHELKHIVVDSDMAVLIVHGDLAAGEALTDALPELSSAASTDLAIDQAPMLRRVIDYSSAKRLRAAVSRWSFEAGAANVGEDLLFRRRYGVRVRDIATIVYTSGTTDAPKGALITHEALVREGVMVSRTRLHLDEHDRVWSVLPFFHIGGIVFAFACFAVTAAYVHAGDFEPGAALRQLAKERCTVALAGFETIWMPILTHPGFATTDLGSLRLAFCLGIPERMREMQGYLPKVPLISTYGSTETCSFFALSDPGDPEDSRMTTSGSILPGLEVRIVDPDTGLEVEPGQVGEILCRGWSRFEGYYNDTKRTEQAIDAEGWFHSGDLGRIDEHGRIAWTSRLKDMMKVGGENVAALEIEGFLLGHAAIRMAQVVAAPDDHYGEVPAAFVMLAPQAHATEEEIIDFCLGRIATFKVPRYVRFVDEWPMSGTKIQKFVLRKWLADELSARGITKAPRLRSGNKAH